MKKFAALMIAGILVFTLAGCGSSGEVSNEDETKSESSAEKTDETEQGDKIVVWAWDKNVDAIEKAAEIYNAGTGKDISLQVEMITGDDIKTTLTTIGESKDYKALPDIVLLQDVDFARYGVSYPDMFYDLTDSADWNQLAEAKSALSVIDGKHYGMPFDSGSSIAMYRVDLLDQAGYTIEDLRNITWERVIEIGKDFYDKTGYYLISDENNCVMEQMITSTGESLFKEDGSADIKDNEIVAEAMSLYKQAVDNHVIYMSNDWNDYIASFTGGKVAAGVIRGAWIANNVNTAPEQAGLWDIANLPQLNEAKGSNYTNNGGSSWFVINDSEYAEEAAEFLSYIYCGEGMDEYIDFMTYDIGYVTTYQPIVNTDYYSNIDDGFYPQGFWGTLAESAANAPVFEASSIFDATIKALASAAQEVVAGADIDTSLANVQETLDFEVH